jgi:hypothetical protein
VGGQTVGFDYDDLQECTHNALASRLQTVWGMMNKLHDCTVLYSVRTYTVHSSFEVLNSDLSFPVTVHTSEQLVGWRRIMR